MKYIGNILIILGIIVTVVSIITMVTQVDAIDDACNNKGGLMVKSSSGWICAKIERL